MKRLLWTGLALLLPVFARADLHPVAGVRLGTTLQVGATFYVSSGTVTSLNTTTLKFADGTSKTTADISVLVSSFTSSGSTGPQSITGVGFKPRVVIMYEGISNSGTQILWSLGAGDYNLNQWVSMFSQSTLASAATVNTTAIIGLTGISSARLTSMDTDGFTITNDVANSQAIHFIAIK